MTNYKAKFSTASNEHTFCLEDYGYDNGEKWEDLTEEQQLEIEDSIREMYAIVYIDIKEQ